MKDTLNEIKNAVVDRLTSPFLGKLILSWFIWNWKIPYITFFVNEDNLDGENKLEFVAEHLKTNNFQDFIMIYFIPLVVTITIIWGIPYLSHEAYKSSENFRKKRALKRKKTDEEIRNNREVILQQLDDRIKLNQDRNEELILLVKYLNEERINKNKVNFNELKNQFKSLKRNTNSMERVSLLIETYNKNSSSKKSFSNKLEKNDRDFLINNLIIDSESNDEKLTEFGVYVSKCKLFKKYNWSLDPYPDHYIS